MWTSPISVWLLPLDPAPRETERGSDGLRVGEGYENSIWNSKGNCSGNPTVALGSSYSCVEDERVVGKGYCLGSTVEIRRCAILPKEEKNCRYSEETMGGGKMIGNGYGFTGPLEGPHKKEEMLMYGVREVSISGIGVSNEVAMMSEGKGSSEVAKANNLWKTESNDGCFLQGSAQVEAYHSFLGAMSEPVKAEGMQMGHHQHSEFHCGFLEGHGSECLVGDRQGSDMGSDMGSPGVGCGLQEDLCSLTDELDVLPGEPVPGQRRQKKRDQNKTAAHRYDSSSCNAHHNI